MSDYRVIMNPWERGWELHITGLGVTQARNLSEADETVRDYIEIMEGPAAAKSARLIYA